MKLFLVRLLLYSFLGISILMFFEGFVFPKNTNVMSLKNRLLSINDAEILVLGNSHTFFGINPSFLNKKTINIANKSRKLETDYLILRKNIEKLSNIKTVIIPISHYTLFTKDISKKEKRLYYNFYNLEEYNQGYFQNSLVLNLSFKELIDNAFFHKPLFSDLGWRANSENYKYSEETTKKKIGNIEERLKRELTVKMNLNYFEQIISLCEINHKKLVIALPPYHLDFYKFSENRYDIEIKNRLSSIDLKSTRIIDGRSLKINNDSLYENIDHLNKNGAEVFTKKIDSILNSEIYE